MAVRRPDSVEEQLKGLSIGQFKERSPVSPNSTQLTSSGWETDMSDYVSQPRSSSRGSAYRPPSTDRLPSRTTPIESDGYGSRTPTPSQSYYHDGYQTSPVSPYVHASPPPDIEYRNYSPFSPLYSTRREPTPVYYDPESTLRIRNTSRPPSDWADSGVEEEPVLKRSVCSPEACKFYIEQHMENVLKAYQQRQQRRLRLEQEMVKRNLDERTSDHMRRILAQKETNYLRLKRAKLDISMFDTIQILGVGAFGTVSLVRKKDTSALYAMKTLRKVDVVKKNQVAHVKAERDILAEADNEWVVKLFFSFKDQENLYFVMEYIPGGDMMSLLIKLGTFPEHLALFYTAELVCAIDSVHKMGFIHRDIKPDNILIDVDGHIKLTDFGLCTGFRWTHQSRTYQPSEPSHQRRNSMDLLDPGLDNFCHHQQQPKVLEKRKACDNRRCMAHSLVGTPNYIACEVLRRQGYTHTCDWWSVGVILYEMIVGHPPFMAGSPSDTQMKIINWSHHLHIPPQARSRISPQAYNLILCLICDPERRLGTNGADEMKKHPFFQLIDWDVGIRNYEPPYIPKITHDLDTSHFDDIPASSLQRRKNEDPNAVLDGPDYAFSDWTFRRFWLEERLHQNQENRKTPTQSSAPPYNGGSNPMPPPPPPSGPAPAKEPPKSKPQPIYV
uniref:non-specific serine/threonine protein kinase n=1 Tax=Halisarca dujardinii TaxID=2583056 RepID=A0AA50AFF0_HALDU|nr:LATS [Halisarca dujardinii]